MNASELAKYFDHTALKAETTAQDIRKLCDEAIRLGTATVCVNAVWIPLASSCLKGSQVLPIAVVGFPLGANSTAAKVFEARSAIAQGACEIDMVISVGELKSGQKDAVHRDIQAVQKACGDAPLKVIFETSLLSESEITWLATICAEEGVAFVKTSTGFGSRGASIQDMNLMRDAIRGVSGAITKIKASGGIRTLKDTLALIEAGADRIGASATVSIVAELSGGATAERQGY